MPMVRLYDKGGDPMDDGFEDLDMLTVPDVGDRILLDYSAGDRRSYRVLSREFYFPIKIGEEHPEYQVVGLEVEPI